MQSEWGHGILPEENDKLKAMSIETRRRFLMLLRLEWDIGVEIIKIIADATPKPPGKPDSWTNIIELLQAAAKVKGHADQWGQIEKELNSLRK